MLAGLNIADTDRDNIMLTAAENGHTEILCTLLTGHTFTSNADLKKAIIKASAKGHSGVVRLLLSTDHPALKGCLAPAIEAATQKGQFKTAALLYSAALDIAGRDNDPDMSVIRNACAGDYEKVLASFWFPAALTLGQASPTTWFYGDCALIGAAEKGHHAIVSTLTIDCGRNSQTPCGATPSNGRGKRAY